VYNQKTFAEFIPIYNTLVKSFATNIFEEFINDVAHYQKQITKLFMTLQDFGHSRDKTFNDFLNRYTEAIIPVDDIRIWIANDKNSDKVKNNYIRQSFNDAKKHIDYIISNAPVWKKNIGVSDSDYERIDPHNRKRTE
jgi:hypothetical protein